MLKPQYNNLKLVLHHNSTPVAACSARYLGLLGLFIDISKVNYPRFTHLELEVVKPESQNLERVIFPVVVTACFQDGLGLTFTNHNENMINKWMSVLTKAVP